MIVPIRDTANNFDEHTKAKLTNKLSQIHQQSNIITQWINNTKLDASHPSIKKLKEATSPKKTIRLGRNKEPKSSSTFFKKAKESFQSNKSNLTLFEQP